MKYSVVIHKDPKSDYGVTVPDLAGCFSAGSTLDEALENAKEAIECHLEGLLIDHETIPLSKNIEEHQSNPEYEEGVWAVVSIDISQLSGKARRVNVTFPEKLLSQMDKYASSRGETRSGLLAQAAVEYMANHSQ